MSTTDPHVARPEAPMLGDVAIRPMYNHILLEQVVETETAGGLALPERRREDGLIRAKVLAVGPGVILRDQETGEETGRIPWPEDVVKVGDVVWLSRWSGHPIVPKDRTLRLAVLGDIAAVEES